MPRGPSTPSSISSDGYAQDQFVPLGGPPTPSSLYSNGRSASPATIASGRKSPYRMPPRSATAPLPPRSPSPELPLPQECAFPIFPLPPSRSATPTTPRRLPIERAQTEPAQRQLQSHVVSSEDNLREGLDTASQARDGMEGTGQDFQEPFRSVSRPASPATSLNRGRPPSVSSMESRRQRSFSNPRPALEPCVPSEPVPPMPQQVEPAPRPELPLSLTVGAPKRPLPQPTQTSQAKATADPPIKRPADAHFRKPSISAASRPLDEIGSIKTHRPRPLRGRSPADVTAVTSDIPRSHSATGYRMDGGQDNVPPVPQQGDSTRNGHAYSRSRSTVDTRRRPIVATTPVPQQAQVYEVDSAMNANHTPSESTSSNESHASSKATSSSRSSPPVSSLSSSPDRHFESLEMALQSMVPLTATQPPSNSHMPNPPRRAPAKSFSRPTYAALLPIEPQSPPPSIDTAESKPPSQPESPMDPALKGGRLPFLLVDNKHFPPSSSRQPQYPQSAVTPTFSGPDDFGDLAPAPLNLQRPPARRATTSHKGKCRGCAQVITGKSVSSADGRLTGRWHKQCFVCKTCKESFPTMDFYVLGNDPYCSRHYHQLNRSLCSKCDRGIEGQYAETEHEKFHPHCFNCQECHLILRDNYYELNGKIYCEQHAFKTNHLMVGSARRFPERRTTRLMMMM